MLEKEVSLFFNFKGTTAVRLKEAKELLPTNNIKKKPSSALPAKIAKPNAENMTKNSCI